MDAAFHCLYVTPDGQLIDLSKMGENLKSLIIQSDPHTFYNVLFCQEVVSITDRRHQAADIKL